MTTLALVPNPLKSVVTMAGTPLPCQLPHCLILSDLARYALPYGEEGRAVPQPHPHCRPPHSLLCLARCAVCCVHAAVLCGRCEGVLHCCLMNGGSVEVLRAVLLGLPRSMPPSRRPALQLQDVTGATALDAAMAAKNWPAVQLLLAAGALKVRGHAEGGQRGGHRRGGAWRPAGQSGSEAHSVPTVLHASTTVGGQERRPRCDGDGPPLM